MTFLAYMRRLLVLAGLLFALSPAAASADDGPPLWARIPAYDQHVRAQFGRFKAPTPAHNKVTLRVGDLAAHTPISAPRGKGTVRIVIYLDGELVHGVYGTGSACRVDFPVHGLLVRIDGCDTATGTFNVTVANATGKPHRVTVWMQRSG